MKQRNAEAKLQARQDAYDAEVKRGEVSPDGTSTRKDKRHAYHRPGSVKRG